MSDYAKDEQKEQTPYQKWIGEIDAAEKELEKFHARANRVVRRFLDERDAVNASPVLKSVVDSLTTTMTSPELPQKSYSVVSLPTEMTRPISSTLRSSTQSLIDWFRVLVRRGSA
jgi:hypothetical protein